MSGRVLPLLVWTTVVATVVVVDLSAYLVAASRAQQLADAAALAVVSQSARSPHVVAAELAEAGGGLLETCDCPDGAGRAEVVVSVPVPGLMVPALGAGRVAASAGAALVWPGRP